MKKLIYGTLFLALVGIVMVGCEKESSNPSDVNYTIDSKKVKGKNNKSSATEMENLAQAANIENITYSNGDYMVTFYDVSGTYAIDIVSFDDEVLIEYTISEPNSATTDITIDVVDETIAIGNVGNYTFAQYEDYEVSTAENRMKNIMAVITVHHSLSPNSSAFYGDNGTGDTFDPVNPNAERKFWGTKCNQGLSTDGCWETSTGCQKYRVWFKVGPPYDNPDVSTGKAGC
jgi:hypothetical protein